MSEVVGTNFVEAVDQFHEKRWRLCNLYYIENERGEVIKFQPNAIQWNLYNNLWDANVVLKARQHGITTGVMIYFLDECLFYPNQAAGVIAHTIEDMKKLFRKKVQFPFENLPEGLKEALAPETESSYEYVFKNKSSISVGTSFRSSALQYLLISEYGYICANYPEKAEEIKTGALNTLHEGSICVVESTARTRHGHFYELCRDGQKAAQRDVPLTRLDFKFFFFPWYLKPEYRLTDAEAATVPITEKMRTYFSELEAKTGIKLDPNQKAWYIKKRQTLGDKIWSEHPSTAEEAHQTTMEGTYFRNEFIDIYQSKRICKVPHQPGYPVFSSWDLGMDQDSCIWFFQVVGREFHFIKTYANNGFGFSHYRNKMDEFATEGKWIYGRHLAPHDIEVRELGAEVSRKRSAANIGIKFETAPKLPDTEQVAAAQLLLPICWFDEEGCSDGIVALESYRKEWDDRNEKWSDRPIHDWSSHYAKAFMVAAVMQRKVLQGRPKAPQGRVVIRS